MFKEKVEVAPIIKEFQSIFDKETASQGYNSVYSLLDKKIDEIRYITHQYDFKQTSIWKQTLFLESWNYVEVFELMMNSPKAYLKSDQPLKGCVYFIDLDNTIQKRCFSNTLENSSKSPTNINLEIDLYNKQDSNLEFSNIIMIILKETVSNQNSRILQSSASVYVSQFEIGDDYEVKTELSSLQYFLYIGVPIISLVILIIIVVIVVLLKRKKKHKGQAHLKDTKNA